MAKTYNIFISHSWSYSDAYDDLIKLLNKKLYFSFKDYSVPKDDPIHTNGTAKQLSDAIKRQISPCHIVLIVAGVYSSYSNWIDKEIKIAEDGFSESKPILAIKPWGNKRTSQKVQDSADDIVGWNTDSIVNAIRDLSL